MGVEYIQQESNGRRERSNLYGIHAKQTGDCRGTGRLVVGPGIASSRYLFYVHARQWHENVYGCPHHPGHDWAGTRPKALRVSLAGHFCEHRLFFYLFSVVIGTFGGGYRINHFDDFLHIFSGIWIGYASWIILRYLLRNGGAAHLPDSFIALYMISFSLAAAAVWELLEFAGDKLFSFTAQGRDPDDTMIDMIMGLIGGAITACVILLLRRKGLYVKK